MFSRKQISCALALAVVVACLAAGPASADDAKDLTAASDAWQAAYNGGDAAGVAALYSEDGTVMAPNMEAAKGRKAIEALIKMDMAQNPGKLAVKTVKTETSGELAFATGTYTATGADGSTVDKGKWLTVFKKVKGKWMMHYDTWNSDLGMMKH